MYTFDVVGAEGCGLLRTLTVEVVVAAEVAPLFELASTPGAVGPFSSGRGSFVGLLGGSFTAAGGSDWSLSVSVFYDQQGVVKQVSGFFV